MPSRLKPLWGGVMYQPHYCWFSFYARKIIEAPGWLYCEQTSYITCTYILIHGHLDRTVLLRALCFIIECSIHAYSRISTAQEIVLCRKHARPVSLLLNHSSYIAAADLPCCHFLSPFGWDGGGGGPP